MTSMVLIMAIPSNTETDFPKYAPAPDCPYSEDDFIYTLSGDNLPDWVYLDYGRKKIVFAPVDSSLGATGFTFEFKTEFLAFERKNNVNVVIQLLP